MCCWHTNSLDSLYNFAWVVQVTVLTHSFPLTRRSDTACILPRYQAHWAPRSYQTRSPGCTVASDGSPSGSQGLLVVWWGLPSLSQERKGRVGEGTRGERNPFASRAMRKGGARASWRKSTATLAASSSPSASSTLATADDRLLYAGAR
jgi:hypothetical protein